MHTSMLALVKDQGRVSIQSISRPRLTADSDVLVRVELAGLCRTDLYMAEGRIAGKDTLVLGHEFSGIVENAGDDCSQLAVGDRVAINPLFACQTCQFCLKDQSERCQETSFLGIDRDGCFAEYVTVPLSSVFTLPKTISAEQAAYAEPVAASLAVFKSGILPSESGLLLGKNRFSQLLQKILALKGFTNVLVADVQDEIPSHQFDYVIETLIDAQILKTMIRAVRPGGKIILKSRSYEPVPLRLNEAIKKEPIVHIVNYGSFEEALKLMSDQMLEVDDLIDGKYALSEFDYVIKRSKQSESLKPFFAPWKN